MNLCQGVGVFSLSGDGTLRASRAPAVEEERKPVLLTPICAFIALSPSSVIGPQHLELQGADQGDYHEEDIAGRRRNPILTETELLVDVVGGR